MSEGKRHWINVASGRKFSPLDPDPATVCIEDIAAGLSKACRFTGQISRFYSVAEHSILVSYLVPPEDALAGLLHDASEAYLCDIATPVKVHPIFAPYREAEAKLQATIYQRFGLAPEMPDSVKEADAVMVSTEAAYLMPRRHPDWILPRIPLSYEWQVSRIHCLPSAIVERLFLHRFHELGGSL